MKAIIFILVAILLQSNAQICNGSGQVLNQKGHVCIRPQYIEGCLFYGNAKRCSQCQFLYTKTAQGTCALKPLDEVRQCCKKSVGRECIECKDGLMLGASGKCQELSIDGCIQKDFTKQQCKVCSSQFNLIQGICQRAVSNCVKYKDDISKTECMTCSPDFSLISNTCVKNTILGCKNQVNGKCNKCYNPFELVDDSGKCIIQNCKSYNDFGCVACQCGFFITENSFCKPIREGCIRYMRGKCIDCLPSWRLIGSVCALPGCKTISNGLCTKCRSGYNLNNQGRCVIANCIMDGEDFCYKCEDGFIPKNGKCVRAGNNKNIQNDNNNNDDENNNDNENNNIMFGTSR